MLEPAVKASSSEPAFEISLRPPLFEEFAGQGKTVERLRVMVDAAKARGDTLRSRFGINCRLDYDTPEVLASIVSRSAWPWRRPTGKSASRPRKKPTPARRSCLGSKK